MAVLEAASHVAKIKLDSKGQFPPLPGGNNHPCQGIYWAGPRGQKNPCVVKLCGPARGHLHPTLRFCQAWASFFALLMIAKANTTSVPRHRQTISWSLPARGGGYIFNAFMQRPLGQLLHAVFYVFGGAFHPPDLSLPLAYHYRAVSGTG